MGYTGTLAFYSVFYAPFVLLFGLLGQMAAAKLRVLPPRMGWISGSALVTSIGFVPVFLYGSFMVLIAQPEQIQRQHLGRVYAGVKDLRSVNLFPALMDPWSEWKYALSEKDLETLRRRCKPNVGPDSSDTCSFNGALDERSFTSLSIEEDELYIVDGLH